jgi:hypothetical protein
LIPHSSLARLAIVLGSSTDPGSRIGEDRQSCLQAYSRQAAADCEAGSGA